MIVKQQVAIQVNNNRKKTKGRKYKHLKRKDGKTVKLMFPMVYTYIKD